ncbi:MAG: 2Fe-2S iron-sulfur cluster-binding protein [Gemmatimonadales bacterium]
MPPTARTAASTTRRPIEDDLDGECFRVSFVTPAGEHTVTVSADEYLLSAASEAGIDLPSTCLQGWCVSCAGLIEEGEADQTEALRLYAEDIAAGYVLLCSAYPLSDLRIRTHQKEAMQQHRVAHGLPAPLA